MTHTRMLALSCALLLSVSAVQAAEERPLPTNKQEILRELTSLQAEVDRLNAIIAALPGGDLRIVTEGNREEVTGGDQAEPAGGGRVQKIGGSRLGGGGPEQPA